MLTFFLSHPIAFHPVGLVLLPHTRHVIATGLIAPLLGSPHLSLACNIVTTAIPHSIVALPKILVGSNSISVSGFMAYTFTSCLVAHPPLECSIPSPFPITLSLYYVLGLQSRAGARPAWSWSPLLPCLHPYSQDPFLNDSPLL